MALEGRVQATTDNVFLLFLLQSQPRLLTALAPVPVGHAFSRASWKNERERLSRSLPAPLPVPLNREKLPRAAE